MSLGGRIVLLNSMFNSIPIFYLSILKDAGKGWKKDYLNSKGVPLGWCVEWYED